MFLALKMAMNQWNLLLEHQLGDTKFPTQIPIILWKPWMSTFLPQTPPIKFKYNAQTQEHCISNVVFKGKKTVKQHRGRQIKLFFLCVISISLGFISPFIVSKLSSDSNESTTEKKQKERKQNKEREKAVWKVFDPLSFLSLRASIRHGTDT